MSGTTDFIAPSLGRGRDSWCSLDGATLDGPLSSPRIDGGHDFDADCRRLAAQLVAGEAISFRLGSYTEFFIEITPEVATGRRGFVRLWKRIGRKGGETTYYHRLRDGSWQYVAEKHRLKEHDARVLTYLLGALGEAVRELGGLPAPAPAETQEGGG